MLTQLTIRGLAIIDSLAIDFAPGFNVITGETGAGKSILIRALNYLMGGKATSDTVRQGYEQAHVTGVFLVSKDHPARVLLENLGIPLEENEARFSILIRRSISAKGRSQCWVNDVSVTTHSLRELGSSLLDVFAQHENQRLMEGTRHLAYLDAFLENCSVSTHYQNCYQETQKYFRDLEETICLVESGERDRDYFKYRLDELAKFEPTAEEYEGLRTRISEAEKTLEIREALGNAVSCLEGNEESPASKSLWQAARALQPLAYEPWSDLKRRLEEIAQNLEEVSFELSSQANLSEESENSLDVAQNRLFGYQELFRKHGVREVESLLTEYQKLRADQAVLDSAEESVMELVKKLSRSLDELEKASESLSAARRTAARTIKQKVELELQQLAMVGSRFDVEFVDHATQASSRQLNYPNENFQRSWGDVSKRFHRFGSSGAEHVQFLLASNPGEPMMPLARIASGGEISRIMLALKKAFITDAETCVLVFDEIDSGISGRVADVVGGKMRELSSEFQVICISHLAQVAVYADTHFLVQKREKASRTESTIIRLSAEESAQEIARLLSGAEVSASSLVNAHALIEKAKGLAVGMKPSIPVALLKPSKRKEKPRTRPPV